MDCSCSCYVPDPLSWKMGWREFTGIAEPPILQSRIMLAAGPKEMFRSVCKDGFTFTEVCFALYIVLLWALITESHENIIRHETFSMVIPLSPSPLTLIPFHSLLCAFSLPSLTCSTWACSTVRRRRELHLLRRRLDPPVSEGLAKCQGPH